MKVTYCPECCSTLTDKYGLLNEDGTFWGYDCYCKRCEWSGDISPDVPGPEPNPAEVELDG